MSNQKSKHFETKLNCFIYTPNKRLKVRVILLTNLEKIVVIFDSFNEIDLNLLQVKT